MASRDDKSILRASASSVKLNCRRPKSTSMVEDAIDTAIQEGEVDSKDEDEHPSAPTDPPSPELLLYDHIPAPAVPLASRASTPQVSSSGSALRKRVLGSFRDRGDVATLLHVRSPLTAPWKASDDYTGSPDYSLWRRARDSIPRSAATLTLFSGTQYKLIYSCLGDYSWTQPQRHVSLGLRIFPIKSTATRHNTDRSVPRSLGCRVILDRPSHSMSRLSFPSSPSPPVGSHAQGARTHQLTASIIGFGSLRATHHSPDPLPLSAQPRRSSTTTPATQVTVAPPRRRKVSYGMARGQDSSRVSS
ncbi:hypothetical protein OE88DRAFT_1775747 [Heliocybe sulcata]|uniref:Uncharacterized protein n=1 Tax=Heliocybe sulcata TaxID=5364 RepID=A0A5C3MYZ5_9AGAM|nr:hypothetical protein OE88DRAFT_1775747 [Heliocybe sulcata]